MTVLKWWMRTFQVNQKRITSIHGDTVIVAETGTKLPV
jgi:hypothetical protein